MKNVIITLAAIVTLASCTQDNIRVTNDLSTTEYNYTDIDAIDVSGEFEVFIDFSGSNHGVKTEFNKELESVITVENNNGTLTVFYNKSVNIRGNVTNKIYLTTTMIDHVKTTGEVSVSVGNQINTDQLTINMTGESQFAGEIDVNNLTVQLTGESNINMSGKARTTNVEMAGESIFSDYGLIIDNLNISMAGESKVKLRVDETIDISAAGESEFRYMGPAIFKNRSVAGDSKIIKVG